MPVTDSAYLRKQAEKCRWLARHSDEQVARSLEAMADEYETKARELEEPGT